MDNDEFKRTSGPNWVEVAVMDYSTFSVWIYRFDGDMKREDMEDWIEKNTDFNPTRCEWMIGRPGENLHVHQPIMFPITKDTKFNSSYSVIR